MGLFHHNGSNLQYVFADQTDMFLLHSLVRVPLRQYLAYQLKQNDFQAVLFWEKTGTEQWGISFADLDSLRFCSQNNGTILSRRILGLQWNQPLNQPVTIYGREEMRKRFFKILGWSKTAVVATISVFSELFCAKDAPQLRTNTAAGTDIVLTIPSDVSQSNRCFTDPEGILQALDSRVRKAACPENGQDLYSQLNLHLDRDCCCLLRPDRQEVQDLMTRHYFVCCESGSVTQEEAEKVAEMLYQWERSQLLREEPGLETLKEHRSRGPGGFFQTPELLEPLLQWVRERGEEKTPVQFRQLLESRYPQDGDAVPVRVNSPILRKWKKIQAKGTKSIEPRLKAALRWGLSQEEEKRLESCMDMLSRSQQAEDEQGQQYAISALDYLLNTWCNPPQVRELVWKIYDQLFDLQTGRNTMHQRIREIQRAGMEESTSYYKACMFLEVQEKSIRSAYDSLQQLKMGEDIQQAQIIMQDLTRMVLETSQSQSVDLDLDLDLSKLEGLKEPMIYTD